MSDPGVCTPCLGGSRLPLSPVTGAARQLPLCEPLADFESYVLQFGDISSAVLNK